MELSRATQYYSLYASSWYFGVLSRHGVSPLSDERGASSPPDFIEPRSIRDMTDEEYEALLSGIRDRRMILIALHTQAVTLKNKLKSNKLITKIDRYVVRVEKELAKIEKIDETVQLLTNQIRGLKIEAIELEDVDV